jgi:hypothetical protein
MVFVPAAKVYHSHARSIREYWGRKLAIGLWKAMLLRRHPERTLTDSHTPQWLRAQIGLLLLFPPGVVAGLVWPPAWWAVLAIAVAFVASTFPLLLRLARTDPPVLLVAPGLIVVRDLALVIGLVGGMAARADRYLRRVQDGSRGVSPRDDGPS